ncbi:MAG: response regulator [Rhodocyclaceae bacterium]|nr:response regulator [Rhodocyclaceae bacterium]
MSRLYRFAPLWGLFLGCSAALFVGVRTQQANDARVAAAFEVLASRAASQVQRRMGSYEYGLRGLRGAVIGAGDAGMTRDIFSRYMSSRNLEREFPGARGFGLVRRIAPSQERAFLQAARRDGWPDFHVTQLQPNDGDRFVIQYIEPVSRNLPAVGLDIASEKSRHAAALRSMRDGEVALTEPIALVQKDDHAKNGFLLLLPIYRPDMPVDGEAPREAALFGWSFVAVAMDEALNDFDYRDNRFSLQIHDYDAPAELQTFYRAADFDAPGQPGLQTSITIPVGGREWTVDVQATPAFIGSLNLDSPWVLGGAVAALSVLLSMLMAMIQIATKRNAALAAAETLHRGNERYRALVNGVNDYAIIQLDTKGKVTAWNSGAEVIKGYTADEAIGKHFSLFYPTEMLTPDYLDTKLARAAAHGSDQDEGWRVRKDGSRFWAAVTITPLRDDNGDIVGYSKITRDLTEKREQENALRDLNALQQAILDNAGVAIIACTRGGIIRLFNPSAEKLLGYTAAELVKKYSPSIFHDQEEVFERAEALSMELGVRVEPGFETFVIKAKNGGVDRHNWTYIAKDGRRIPVQLSITGLFDEERNLLGYVGLAVDLTDQKRREAEIVAARELAERATRAKSEFLANMSHEIRTPMNAILGMTQLVLQSDLQAQQRDYLGKAFSASKALLAILNDILDYSKIEAGRMELEHREMSLEATLSNTLALFGAQAEQKGLELVLDAPAELPGPLQGDPLRLSQVLSNLLGNAIKFTERGVVTLKVECLSQEQRACRMRFSVADTGIGMSAEQVGRLFVPFSQADTSITRRFGGTGLGLSISKTLVDLMGGALRVESEPGKGSSFSFEIDFQRTSVVPARQESMQRIGIHRALVVDDQETAALVLKLQLNSWGIAARVAGSGAVALSLLAEAERKGAPFDLMLLDWKMPEMDGLALATTIEEKVDSGALTHMPIVMMVSAYSRDELLRHIGALRISAVLSKPIMPSLLFNTLMELEAPGAGAARETPDPAARYKNLAAPLQNAHVLLAEDNPLNQQVALAFLDAAGIQVTVVDNGRLALEHVEAEPQRYDAVLMDLQMPEMDGLEATLRIRQLPGCETLPIIAMTAAVMERDQQACMEAGMNDFIAKPIEPERLIQRLCHWIRPQAASTTSGAPVVAAQPDLPDALLKRPDIDTTTAVHRMAGNRAIYLRLLRDFAMQAGTLEARIAAADRGELSMLIHQLKSETGNLGLNRLSELCAALEPALNDAQAPMPTQDIAALRAGLRTMAVDLIAALPPADTTDKDSARRVLDAAEIVQLRAQLRQLMPLLASQRMQALSLADSIAALLVDTDLGADFGGIHDKIRQLRFPAAYPQLEALIAAVEKSN